MRDATISVFIEF